MPEHMTDAHFSFTFVFKQALIYPGVPFPSKKVQEMARRHI